MCRIYLKIATSCSIIATSQDQRLPCIMKKAPHIARLDIYRSTYYFRVR